MVSLLSSPLSLKCWSVLQWFSQHELQWSHLFLRGFDPFTVLIWKSITLVCPMAFSGPQNTFCYFSKLFISFSLTAGFLCKVAFSPIFNSLISVNQFPFRVFSLSLLDISLEFSLISSSAISFVTFWSLHCFLLPLLDFESFFDSSCWSRSPFKILLNYV